MTINELLRHLRMAKKDAPVSYDFCGCIPTTVDSWRGIYAEPAIGWKENDWQSEAPKVGELIEKLESAIDGREYDGWKGGAYSYTGNEPLHIDNPGESTNTEISSVEIIGDEWERVVIHTRREP